MPDPSYCTQPAFHVVDMVEGVVEGVFEHASNIAAVVAEGQAACPRRLAGVVGELREAMGVVIDRVDHGGWIFGVVVRRGLIGETRFDFGKDRLVSGQCLFDAERMEGGDVPGVCGVLDR